MIFDSCTFARHTGQLTITPEEEEEEEEEGTLDTCVEDAEEEAAVVEEEEEAEAGDVVFTVFPEAAESLFSVFWKKSKMLAELLSSHGLFLDS